ncbi:hypothetical protein [Marinobacter sp. SS5-14b]|uniref:hypothetical protein n=1 Tax=Marinobacter sp. SS5-14b TaxID=3050456 RepID=UPI0026DF8B01|nr:hypothetical protein [Marinobacter sp. SS5-14b]
MARIVDLDHKWATLVGRLLIAFAAMEGLTLHCLKEWLKSPVYKHVMNMGFAQRVDLVIDLAREQDSPEDKIEAFVKNLKKAKALAKRRNAVAHNPLVLCLFDEQEEFIEAIASEKKEDEVIEFEELEQLVSKAEALEQELSESKVRLREHEWKPLS